MSAHGQLIEDRALQLLALLLQYATWCAHAIQIYMHTSTAVLTVLVKSLVHPDTQRLIIIIYTGAITCTPIKLEVITLAHAVQTSVFTV